MKHRYIIVLLLCAHAGLQSMESQIEKLPNLKPTENALRDIFINAVKEIGNKALENKQITLVGTLINHGKHLGLSNVQINEVLTTVKINGNTITHMLVLYGNNDELAKCAKQEIISFEENEQGLTAYDEIAKKYLHYVTQPTIICDAQADFNRTKCSYLILTNYIKIKQNRKDECVLCCKDHNFFANDNDIKI